MKVEFNFCLWYTMGLMSIEMGLNPSRRDFILAFAKKRRGGGQPSQRRTSGTNSSQPQPNGGGFKFTRRQALIGGSIIGGGVIAGILKPWEWVAPQHGQEIKPTLSPTPTIIKPVERSTTPELEKLGQEIRTWKLQDGRKMSDLFTEVLLTADLLQGNLDPKTVLPQFKGPMTLSIDPKIEIGGLSIDEKFDRNDPRKVGLYNEGKLIYTDNWLTASSVTLQLGPNIRSSEARLYIAVKEVTQLLYRLQYQQLYKVLLEQGNTEFVVTNPTDIPTSEDEKASNFGSIIGRFERNKFGYSSLDDFIDVGSRLQTAQVGATQRLDLERRGQSFGNPFWSRIEQSDTNFLKSKGLLKESDGIVTWVEPFAVDEDFFRLFAEYVQPIRPSLIVPLR